MEDAATLRVSVPASPVLKPTLKKSSQQEPATSPAVAAEPLPEEIPLDSLKSVLPALVDGHVKDHRKDFVLGRNIHSSCLEITEPEMDDEVTGEKDAYMAGVLSRYRKTLVEKTKYHLGASK